MDIVFQGHHAHVSPRLQGRAAQGLEKLGRRIGGVVDATVRFQEDGPQRCVSVELHAAGGRRFVAEGRARFFGPALAVALAKLNAQIGHVKRTPKAKARWLARAS